MQAKSNPEYYLPIKSTLINVLQFQNQMYFHIKIMRFDFQKFCPNT